MVFPHESKLGMLLERADEWAGNSANRQERTVVKMVIENGAADSRGVRLGSKLLSVNNEDVSSRPYLEALEMVKTMPRPLTLKFENCGFVKDASQDYCLVRKAQGYYAPQQYKQWSRQYFVIGGAVAKGNVLQVARLVLRSAPDAASLPPRCRCRCSHSRPLPTASASPRIAVQRPRPVVLVQDRFRAGGGKYVPKPADHGDRVQGVQAGPVFQVRPVPREALWSVPAPARRAPLSNSAGRPPLYSLPPTLRTRRTDDHLLLAQEPGFQDQGPQDRKRERCRGHGPLCAGQEVYHGGGAAAGSTPRETKERGEARPGRRGVLIRAEVGPRWGWMWLRFFKKRVLCAV